MISQITNSGSKKTIAPASTVAERVTYRRHEGGQVENLLDDYANIELVYEALLEYTLALEHVEHRKPRSGRDQTRLLAWLATLQVLDHMRAGRSKDMERPSARQVIIKVIVERFQTQSLLQSIKNKPHN